MERAAKQQSFFEGELTASNVEEHVDTFLGLVDPAHLIGTSGQRDEFSQTLSRFKHDIRNQVSPLEANAMLRKLDESVAARHYDEVRKVLDDGAVTAEFITAIRETPVAFSPAQKNIDKLHRTALADQQQARTAEKRFQPALRDRAKHSAKVAASYAADTPVVKNGRVTLIGEQYTLQKLHETHHQLPKNDDARKDVLGVVRDAYGEDYTLKDTREGLIRVRQAVAAIATAAVLSSLSNTAAHAGESKTSEVVPNQTRVDKYIKDAKQKVIVPASEVNSTSSSAKADGATPSIEVPQDATLKVTPTKSENHPVSSTKAESITPASTDQNLNISTKLQESDDQRDRKMDSVTDGDLVFKIPSASAKKPNSKDLVARDLKMQVPDDSKSADALIGSPSENVSIENSTNTDVHNVVEQNEKSQIDIDNPQVESEQDKKVNPGVRIEGVLDDSQLTFKLPKEKQRSNELKPIEISISVDDTLSFSLNKDRKNPGVKPIELPGGLEIIPIPTVPTPALETPTPAPSPEQPPAPGSDFSQAAKKLAERGGLWERRGIAMQFLIDDPELAFTPSQAAGIVGNLLGESGPEMNPGQSQYGGPAFGIVQWEGGRLLDLGAFAGKDQADFMTQLKFLKYELLGKERAAFNAIKTATNRKDAALIVRERYERPSAHRDEDRIAFAHEVGDAFNKEYQTILASRVVPKVEEKPNSILAGWPTTGEAAMKLFNQCDPIWGEIKTPNGTRACDVSCGPTAVAMAVNALTGRPITPKEVIEFTNANKMWLPGDRGTSFDAAINLGKNFGINGAQMANFKDINAYREILKNGGMILVAGSGPAPFVPQNIGAHFVLIRGITADNKFLVADPYPKTPDTNTVAWDSAQIINGTFGAVVFTK